MYKKIQIQSVLDTTVHKYKQQYWAKEDNNKPELISKQRYFELYDLECTNDSIEVLGQITKW